MFAAHLPKCRMCAYPLMEGGVYLPEVDAGKLSEWWHSETGVRIDDTLIRNSWACVFCVRRARLSVELNGKRSDEAWWPSDIQDQHFQYYKNGWLKACSVQLRKLTEEDITNFVAEPMEIKEEPEDSQMAEEEITKSSNPMKLEPLEIKEELEVVEEVAPFEFVDTSEVRGESPPCSSSLDLDSNCSSSRSSNCDDSSIPLCLDISKNNLDDLLPTDNFTEIRLSSLGVYCSKCTKSFANQKAYQMHRISKQECHLCGTLMRSVCKLRRHLDKDHCKTSKVQDKLCKTVQLEDLFSCSFCDHTAKDEAAMVVHFNAKHLPCLRMLRQLCLHCKILFKNNQEHRYHVCSKPVKIECKFCKVKVNTPVLALHEKSCKCYTCFETFDCATFLHYHTLETKIQCFVCKARKVFCRTSDLNLHVKKVHKMNISEMNKKPVFACKHCHVMGKEEKLYETRNLLRRHTLTEHPSYFQHLVCDFCGFLLANAAQESSHVRNWHGLKPCCYECALLFEDKEALDHHNLNDHKRHKPKLK